MVIIYASFFFNQYFCFCSTKNRYHHKILLFIRIYFIASFTFSSFTNFPDFTRFKMSIILFGSYIIIVTFFYGSEFIHISL